MTATLGIAIPSFEQPEYADEAIRSLRATTVPFRAIIQDAGSSPETIAVLRRAIDEDPRIDLVVEADDGQSDAINRAWRRLLDDHPYVTWFNTDDVLLPGGLEALMEFASKHPDAVVTYGDLDAIDKDGKVVGWTRAPNRVRRFRLVYHHNLVPGIIPVIRSEALRRTGLLDTSLHYAMDHELFVRLAALGALRRVPVTVAGYRTHNKAKTWGDKAASEAETASVRVRYRSLPLPAAKALRTGLRLAWWPIRRRYNRGVMRQTNRDFGVNSTRTT